MSEPWARGDYDGLEPFAYEQVTVGSSAVSLTESVYQPTVGAPALKARCKVEDDSIRWRSDGQNPTNMLGYPQDDGDEFVLWGAKEILSFRAIRSGQGDAKLNVIYYR